MGRNRKQLKDKSTSILLRIDNKTLFNLCDILGINYDENAEILDDEVKRMINVEIKKIIGEFVK